MSFIVNDTLGNPYALVVDPGGASYTLTAVIDQSPSQNDNSISITALALISSALRLIGVVASGEAVDTSAASDSLMVLNQMIDGWNADRLAIFGTTYADYALIPGQQAYTIGPGGDFNTNRPASIDSMSVILLDNPSNPIEIPLSSFTVEQWQTELTVKAVNSTFPQIYYDDGGFPLRTINLWPLPNIANRLRIYSWQPLGLSTRLTTVLSFPPGYAEAFRYNLAVRLGAEFAAPVSPTVQQIAVQSLGRIKSMNAPELLLRSDLANGYGNWNARAELFGLPY
jgi:hypothetical protein